MRSRTAATLVAALMLAAPAAAQTPAGARPAGSRRVRPATVRLSPTALKKRAVTCKVPEYPARLHMKSNVVVEILIDEGGAVRSAKAVYGHPLLQASAVQAARRWTFLPFKVRGKAVKTVGLLTLRFSYYADEMEKQCDGIERAP